ncbi:MAG: hemerythrin domain-containing protein [Hyphomonas sp.]
MTSIYERLKSDHDTHRDLLAQLADTTGDSSSRRELWERFYYDVGAHAAAEEEAFYAPLMEGSKGQPKARHSVSEHHELDEMIQDLEDMDFSSPGWLTRFKTMRDRYEHHIDEEENEIFETARKVLGADSSGEIAATFDTRKKKERKLVDEKAEAELEE